MKIKCMKWIESGKDTEDIKMPLVTNGNACFDFYAPEKHVIYPGEKHHFIGTGIAFEIPDGYHMKLFMRSSYGAKHTLRQSNCVGIIDSSYRKEVKEMFDNIGDQPEVIEKGERFAQGMIEKNIPIEFVEVSKIKDTARGGFGSTGK